MKKIFKILGACVIITFLLLTTSCFDVVQAISLKGNKYNFYTKLAVPKSLSTLSGDDFEQMFEDMANNNDFKENPNAKLKSFSTEFDVGIELKIEIDKYEADKNLKDLLPYSSGNKVILPLSIVEKTYYSLDNYSNQGSTEEQIMAKMMLSSIKFRYIISKDILPIAKKAYLNKITGERIEIGIFDYGDVFCVEIPPLVYIADGVDKSKVVIER